MLARKVVMKNDNQQAENSFSSVRHYFTTADTVRTARLILMNSDVVMINKCLITNSQIPMREHGGLLGRF